jgi:hypothetical protein
MWRRHGDMVICYSKQEKHMRNCSLDAEEGRGRVGERSIITYCQRWSWLAAAMKEIRGRRATTVKEIRRRSTAAR